MRLHYDKGELLADGIIHGLGILFGLIAIVALCVITAWTVDPWEFTAVLIYSVALLTVLTVSALYNLWPASPVKWILRRDRQPGILLLEPAAYPPVITQTNARPD